MLHASVGEQGFNIDSGIYKDNSTSLNGLQSLSLSQQTFIEIFFTDTQLECRRCRTL